MTHQGEGPTLSDAEIDRIAARVLRRLTKALIRALLPMSADPRSRRPEVETVCISESDRLLHERAREKLARKFGWQNQR